VIYFSKVFALNILLRLVNPAALDFLLFSTIGSVSAMQDNQLILHPNCT
jgi:hypothetical protein